MQTLSKNKLFRFGMFFLLNSILLGWLLFGSEPVANHAQALFPLGGSDTCTAATPIIGTFPYNDTGSTTGATDNYDLPQDETAPTCTAPVGWAQGGVTATSGDRGAIFDGTGTGPDVAYSVKTDKTCRLQASMTPTGFDDLALIVYLAQCTNSLNNCVVVSDISGEGGGETVKWEAAAGQTYYIVVDGYTPPETFPYSSGPYTLQVSEITSTGCEAYGSGPEITVSQGGNDIRDEVGAVNFGTTPVGTPVDKTFIVSNIGTSTLSLTQPPPAYMPMMPPGFSLVGTPIPTSLPPGGSMTFIVRMTAAAPGNFSGMMSIGTNDSNENPFNFTLSGVVTAPEIAVSLDGANIIDNGPMVSFGTTPLGTALNKTFTVSNIGTANLTLGQINLPAGFSLVSPFGSTTVTPGNSTTFTVRLEANTPGYAEGELSFDNNDSNENPFNFFISGMVIAPEITVSQDGSDIADGGGPVSFGTTTVGTAVDKTFTITNVGTANLTLVEPISLPAGFSLVNSFGSTSLAPGQSTSFVVRLTAAAPGSFSGTLSFGDNDSDDNPFNFTISGTVNGLPEIAVSQGGSDIPDGTGSLNFGTTAIGTAVERIFTISNAGTADLTLAEPINLPAGFSLVNSFGSTTLTPGGFTTFTVRLTAAAPGSYSGPLSFGNNDGNENPFNFTISGSVATAPEITVSLGGSDIAVGSGPVSFGTTTVGTAVDMTFTITNAGTGNLTLVEPINLPAGFSLVSSFGSTTLASGESTSFVVRLTATAPGNFAGTLSFGNNDGDENLFDFTINGEVLPRFIYLPLVTR